MPLSEEAWERIDHAVREAEGRLADEGIAPVPKLLRITAVDAIIEECARVAEATAEEAGPHNSWSKSGHTIAERIRALKSGGPNA